MSKNYETVEVDGDKYMKLSTGLMVNISELVRMSHAVTDAIKPGMSEAEIDALIAATVKRMSPN